MSEPASSSASGSASTSPPARLPTSDVSSMVGILGLAGLLSWIVFCRYWPEIAGVLGVPGVHIRLSGPEAALFGLVMSALPMVIWSVFVDKVHLRASTGLDWSLRKARSGDSKTTWTKLISLWVTWAIIGGLYVMGRWYWQGSYGFALTAIGYAIIPAVLLSIPYVRWIDRVMVGPRDHSWHFGAMLLGQEGWELEEVKKHWRSWIIKGFFTAFMLSIVPAGFAYVVNADLHTIISNPAVLGILLIELLFVIDVQIGTVGYVLTNRPLDAHIRSGNPLLGGWIAAMICYPPLVWGIIGNGMVLGYENHTRDWTYWLGGNDVLLWAWAAWLVLLTAIYAAATVVFGMRFSNLTYRGVITHGPFKYTRHPAYLSKNIFWWCSVLPFLVTSDSMADAVRNVFALLCVNAIYYWRAKTEEAHLLAEDPKYREYHAWMGEHGVITAPLRRLGDAVRSRFLPGLARQ